MPTLDPEALAHHGYTRATPPGTGAEPQRDAMLRAHFGWLALRTDEAPVDDVVFCVVLQDDGEFRVRLRDDEAMCAVLADDEDFRALVRDDETLCVVLVDDDEVRIK